MLEMGRSIQLLNLNIKTAFSSTRLLISVITGKSLELVNDVDELDEYPEEYSEEIRVGDSVVVVGTYFTKEAGLDPEPSPFSEDPAEVIDILGRTGIAKLSTGEYYHLKDLEISEPNFGSEFKVGDIVKVTNKVEHERGYICRRRSPPSVRNLA